MSIKCRIRYGLYVYGSWAVGMVDDRGRGPVIGSRRGRNGSSVEGLRQDRRHVLLEADARLLLERRRWRAARERAQEYESSECSYCRHY